MIVSLLLSSMNLFGQTDVPSLRGNSDTLVGIPIRNIRQANIKLVERQELLEICDIQEQMISDYKVLTKEQNIALTSYELKADSLSTIIIKNQELNHKLSNKANNRLIFGICSSAVIIGLTIALIYGK